MTKISDNQDNYYLLYMAPRCRAPGMSSFPWEHLMALFLISISTKETKIRNSGGNKTMLMFWGYMKAAGKIKLKGYKNGKTSYM